MSKNFPKDKTVDLSNIAKASNGKYDWENSIGAIIPFKYGRQEGILKITGYDYYTSNKNKVLNVSYNNIDGNFIPPESLKKVMIKSIIGYNNSHYEIGDRIIDGDFDVTITNKKIARSSCGKLDVYYQYKCNKCGFDCGKHYYKEELRNEYWIKDADLFKKHKCICCQSIGAEVVVPEINSIVATDPWMIKYFEGGYEEAQKYKKCSTKRKFFVCPDCNMKQKTESTIYNLYTHHGISCKFCGDGISYPEKLIHNIFYLLDINFISQFSSCNEKWCRNYRYDFYFELNENKYIVEAHGGQHYNQNTGNWNTLETIQSNDKDKYELAINNGIDPNNYIVLDCRFSDFEYIKTNILQSRLAKIFNLTHIDWDYIYKKSESSIIKIVSDFYNEGLSISQIENKLKLCNACIRNYLKKGTKIGLCDYDNTVYHKSLCKKIGIYKDGVLLDVYDSITKMCNASLEKYGVKLHNARITQYFKDNLDNYKGYTFKYIENEF